jgi:hypothetical protein
VTEQSEHLSSAQIENYGNRSSGAGPESEQRDEPQHADDQHFLDQSVDDQHVEAHLADCPSCRNRLLDFHRAHFALLAGVSAPSGTEATDSSGKELSLGDARRPADSLLRTSSTPECPSDDDLRQLAAGLSLNDLATSDALAAQLTQHTATCDHCGPLLRTYTEIFSDDFTSEEQAALANLQSSSAEWQKNTARQMLEASGVQPAVAPATDGPSPPQKSRAKPTIERKPFFWKWILVPATAAVVVMAAFSIWYTQRDTPEKAEKLMAQAYTEQRTTEMRIPYAAHADFKQTRSGDGESRLNSPAALSKAAEQISGRLQKEPDDPKWLMLRARVDLLDWNYKPALSSLEKISEAQVTQSPEFLMTRAFALYERSEVLKESQGYFEAVNLLGKALQKTPDDPVLLFNQAIVCEKIHSYECAKGDWGRFLTIEKDPAWTSEARKHLQQIEEKKTLGP